MEYSLTWPDWDVCTLKCAITYVAVYIACSISVHAATLCAEIAVWPRETT